MKDFLVMNTEDGYEGLYVDGELVEDGDPIGEGDRLYLSKKIISLGGDLGSVRFEEFSDIDMRLIEDSGELLEHLSDYKGNYKKNKQQ